MRALREGDVAACEALLRAAYAPVVVTPGYLDIAADVAARAATAEVLVADDAGTVVGCVTLVLDDGPWREIRRDREAEFRMLATDPAHQGRGVGASLVRAVADRARAAGCTALVCSSAATMTAGHRLYARLGFMRAPERDWVTPRGAALVVFELPLRG